LHRGKVRLFQNVERAISFFERIAAKADELEAASEREIKRMKRKARRERIPQR
jgi:hypothetical protein